MKWLLIGILSFCMFMTIKDLGTLFDHHEEQQRRIDHLKYRIQVLEKGVTESEGKR